MANEQRGPTVQVACYCRGRNPACSLCGGIGTVIKKACRRCGGIGKEGPNAKCPDCRGDGHRDIDQSTFQ